MSTLDDIYNAHSDAIDALVSEFTSKYHGIVDRASATLQGELANKLKTTAGDTVALTSRNQTLLSNLDTRFDELMNAEGLPDLLESYTASFNGQFEWFNQVLSEVSGQLVYPLPEVTFTKGDLAGFSLQKVSSQDVIRGAVDKVGTRAKQQALQSIGALNTKQLTAQLVQTLGSSVADASSLAETSISTFYRTITDKGFQLIEDDLPGFKVRYNYNGPLDKLNRPFCAKLERLSRAGRTWTREQISKMSNGQIPNVRVTCGGYRCRHQWMISVGDMKSQQQQKGKPEKTAKPKVTRGKVANELDARRALNSISMQQRLGVPHPHDQIAAIRANVETTIKERRASVNA